VWDNSTATPLERPRNLGNREFFTEEEAAELNETAAVGADRPLQAGNTGTYNAFWFDRGAVLPDRRTSLIVDPRNGQLPPFTPEAQKRNAVRREVVRGREGADSWADRSLRERCIIYHPVPGLPTAYNNNYQIVQSPDSVAILTEEIHETRVIPLGGRPHIPKGVALWLGDSRGRWEGDTLVVETTNLMDHFPYVLTNGLILQDENVRVIERFTRVSPEIIEYRFTVENPTTYTAPWTAMLPMRRNPGQLYEYACHEGNYSMTQMLSGARAEEKQAAEAAKKAASSR
jgi:hypothetical protein